jgi:hypothetical protein
MLVAGDIQPTHLLLIFFFLLLTFSMCRNIVRNGKRLFSVEDL